MSLTESLRERGHLFPDVLTSQPVSLRGRVQGGRQAALDALREARPQDSHSQLGGHRTDMETVKCEHPPGVRETRPAPLGCPCAPHEYAGWCFLQHRAERGAQLAAGGLVLGHPSSRQPPPWLAAMPTPGLREPPGHWAGGSWVLITCPLSHRPSGAEAPAARGRRHTRMWLQGRGHAGWQARPPPR